MSSLEMEERGMADLLRMLQTLPPELTRNIRNVLKPLLYSTLSSSLQKYFGGSSPARGPAGKLLTSRSGRLLNSVLESLQVLVEPDAITLSIGSNVPYAAIQEYGGYAGRRGPFTKKDGHRPYLPSRPYLNPAMDDLAEALPAYVDEAINQTLGAR